MSRLTNTSKNNPDKNKSGCYKESWSTPIYFGFGACLYAVAENASVFIDLIGKTPNRNYKKKIKLSKDLSFTWSPNSELKVEINISNFHKYRDYSCFDLTIQIWGDVQGQGWKCFTHSHHFSIPTNNKRVEIFLSTLLVNFFLSMTCI